MPRKRFQHLLIRTKTNRPQLPAGLMIRPRLLERLDEASGRQVTLISAPAGYGKKTLAAQWLEPCPSKIAWISLYPERKSPGFWIIWALWIAGMSLPLCGGNSARADRDPKNLPVLQARSSRSEDPLNTTYTIEGKEVRLINGYHEEQTAPGSATKIKTRVFGKPAYGDLDGDGEEDAALFLVQDPGGSGTFYYVAAALRKSGIYQGTNAVFLGDRISPRTIKIQKGVIIVDYADRRPDEPMAAPPSMGKKKYLAVKNGHLEEIKLAGRVEESK